MSKILLAGCVILKNNSILLLHRTETNWYELPGGKVNEGETPEQAAIREIKEELLCDVSIGKLIYNKDFLENGKIFNYTCFLSELNYHQTPKIGEPEIFDHFKYILLDKLSSISLSPNMKNFLKELTLNKISLNNLKK